MPVYSIDIFVRFRMQFAIKSNAKSLLQLWMEMQLTKKVIRALEPSSMGIHSSHIHET